MKSNFKNKFKIWVKCVELIVDGGSTKNLVFDYVIRKLNMRCGPQINSYRIS